MNSLIQITKNIINGAEINSVNLRELHSNLKSKRQFADYAKGRLGRFIENEDYICISQKSEIGNKPLIEYYVTFECAKMIAMMENNEIGDEIRRYFVSIEKQFIQQIKPLTINEQIALIAQGHQEVNKRLDEIEHKIENDITLTSAQKFHLKQLVSKKAYELKETHKLEDSFMSKVFARFYKKLKKHFIVSSYMEIPKSKFDEAIEIVKNVSLGDLI